MARRGSTAPPVSLFSFQDIITSVAGILIFLTLMMTVELVRQKNDSPPLQTSKVLHELNQSIPDTEREIERLERQIDQQQEYLKSVVGLTPSGLASERKSLESQIESLQVEMRTVHEQLADTTRHHQQIARTREQHGGDRESISRSQQRIEQFKQKIEELKRNNQLIYTNAETSKTAWLVELSRDRLQAMRAGQDSAEKQFSKGAVGELKRWIKTLDASQEYVVLIIKPSGVELFEQLEGELDRLGVDIGFDLIEENQTVINSSTASNR